jgi:hypothetical protein
MVPIPPSDGTNVTLVQPRPGFLLDKLVVNAGLYGLLLLAHGGMMVLAAGRHG